MKQYQDYLWGLFRSLCPYEVVFKRFARFLRITAILLAIIQNEGNLKTNSL